MERCKYHYIIHLKEAYVSESYNENSFEHRYVDFESDNVFIHEIFTTVEKEDKTIMIPNTSISYIEKFKIPVEEA